MVQLSTACIVHTMPRTYSIATETEAASAADQLTRRGFTASWTNTDTDVVLTVDGGPLLDAEETLIDAAPSARHLTNS